MSSNIYKSGFVRITAENTRVINGDELAARHIEENSSVLHALRNDSAEEYSEDLSEETDSAIAMLTENPDDITDDSVYEASLTLNPMDVRAECDEMIKDANKKIEMMLEDARAEAENIKAVAKEQGYEEGLNQATVEMTAKLDEAYNRLEVEKKEMQDYYMQCLDELEPRMVSTLASIYEHIFGLSLFNRKDVLLTLLNKALVSVAPDSRVTIYVNSEGAVSINNNREQLMFGVKLHEEPAVLIDDNMIAGTAKIETPYGIMDCSINTELAELNSILKVLSYEGNNENA